MAKLTVFLKNYGQNHKMFQLR